MSVCRVQEGQKIMPCDWCDAKLDYMAIDEGPHLCPDCDYCYWDCETVKHRKECPYWEIKKQ